MGAHPQELLHAVDAALKEEPPREKWRVVDLAAKVAPKHIALQADYVARFIRHGMSAEQRQVRHIEEPKKRAAAY